MIQEIKKEFYRYRNGIIAEALKKIYPEGTLIFGILIPQLKDIASKYPKDLTLGLELWEDTTCRESRLLALFIIPSEKIDFETALKLFSEVKSSEEGDFLAFKVLKNLPFAEELYLELNARTTDKPLEAYTLEMFRKNIYQN